MNEKIVVPIDADLAEIVPGYLKGRREDVVAIPQALAHGDYETIRTLGHRMKGSGGGYGFEVITAIGDTVERAALARDDQEILRQAALLSDYIARVEVVYE